MWCQDSFISCPSYQLLQVAWKLKKFKKSNLRPGHIRDTPADANVSNSWNMYMLDVVGISKIAHLSLSLSIYIYINNEVSNRMQI